MSDSGQSGAGRIPIAPIHILLLLAMAGILAALSPWRRSSEYAHMALGSIAQSRIIAPFDFEILKSSQELEAERAAAAEAVTPVGREYESAADSAAVRISEFGTACRAMLEALPQDWLGATKDSTEEYNGGAGEPFLKGSRALAERFGLHIDGDGWRFLFRLYHSGDIPGARLERFFQTSAREALAELYQLGIIESRIPPASKASITIRRAFEEWDASPASFVPPDSAAARLAGILSGSASEGDLSPAEIEAASAIMAEFAAPSILLDEAETARRREVAIARIPLAKGFVKQDELIIDSHFRVTQEHLDKLRSLAIKRVERAGERGLAGTLAPLLGQFLLALALSAFLWFSIAISRRELWGDSRRLLLIGALVVASLVFLRTIPASVETARIIFPAALVAMLMRILFDRGIAALSVITMAIGAGFLHGSDFQTMAMALGMGGAAIISLRSYSSRADVMRSGVLLAITGILLSAGFHIANYAPIEGYWLQLGAVAATASLTPLIVVGIIPPLSSAFGITTDLALLELVDLNRPLLREMAMKSPGTYHHSLMVGSLAEAAAREVGADPLLTRAGAYYHDIGKIDRKEYYIENQETGSPNVHDRLAPTKSAEILIGHVNRGLEIARKHKLPPAITAFISEHHGQTRLAYFYSKAKREIGEKVNEDRFRYPGPKPRSKETAILMLADVTEAATRSLENPTAAELKKTVDHLVAARLSEGDLDDAPLTIQELEKVKRAFITVLTGIHHQRISYPGRSRSASELDGQV